MIVEKIGALFSVVLNQEANQGDTPDIISTDDSAITVRVIPTDEEGMLARHTVMLMRQHANQKA